MKRTHVPTPGIFSRPRHFFTPLWLIFYLIFCLKPLFQPPPLAAEQATPQKNMVFSRELQRERRFFATVSYPLVYKVFALEGGSIVTNNLEENKVFAKGDLLLELKNDELRLAWLQRRSAVLDAEHGLTRARVEQEYGKKTEAERKKAGESLEIARGQLKLAAEAMEKLSTPAPFDGRAIHVSAKLLKSREQNISDIAKGDLLCEFVDNRPMVLKGVITLPVRGQERVAYTAVIERVGQKAEAEITGLTFLSQASGSHDNFEIVMTLPELDNADWKLGAQVPVSIKLPVKKAELTIPRSLVQSRGDLHFCHVERDGKLLEIPLMLGEYDAEFIEVFGALTPGDLLVKAQDSS